MTTWTLLPDLDDTPNEPVDIEGEQLENLQAAIGLVLWAELQQLEDEGGRTM